MAGSGVELRGLTKTFSTPQGPVEAVRGIDVSIAPRVLVPLWYLRDGSAARPERGRHVDDARHGARPAAAGNGQRQRARRTQKLRVRRHERDAQLRRAQILLFAAGTSLGVRLGAGAWIHMSWQMLVGPAYRRLTGKG